MMAILAGLKALVDILKSAGIIRDRQQEADIQSAFLNSTSGPLYAVARIVVIFVSLWDLFMNGARTWAATGLPPILEYLPVLWLFIGPAIVPFAEAALKAGLSTNRGQRPAVVSPAPAVPTTPVPQPGARLPSLKVEPPAVVPEAPVLREYEVRGGREN